MELYPCSAIFVSEGDGSERSTLLIALVHWHIPHLRTPSSISEGQKQKRYKRKEGRMQKRNKRKDDYALHCREGDRGGQGDMQEDRRIKDTDSGGVDVAFGECITD